MFKQEIRFLISYSLAMFLALIMFVVHYVLCWILFPLIVLDSIYIYIPPILFTIGDVSIITIMQLVGFTSYNVLTVLAALLAAPPVFVLKYLTAALIVPIMFLNMLDLEIQLLPFIDQYTTSIIQIAGIQYL